MSKSILKVLIVLLITQLSISCHFNNDSDTTITKDNKKTEAVNAMIQELIKKVERFPKKKNQIVLLPLNEKEKLIAINTSDKIMIIRMLILQEAEMNKAISTHNADVNRIIASFMINENSYSKKFGETWVETMQKPAKH